MASSERSGNILSFIGKPFKGKYTTSNYIFSSDDQEKSYTGRYASAVYFIHLINSGKKLSKCIICGTLSSVWDTLSDEYKDIVQQYESKLNIRNSITESLSSDNFSIINREIQELIRTNKSYSLLREKLNVLETMFNSAFEPYTTTFHFVIHHDKFQTYTEQNSLLEDLVCNNLFDKNADIYLDLTYGLRVMPFFTYTGLHCLRQSNNLNIREIVYFKESFKISPKLRLDRVEIIKSKLRYLSLTEPEKFHELHPKISELIKTGQTSTPSQSKNPSFVCSLKVTEKYMLFAEHITKFKYSGDLGEFEDLIKDNTPEEAVALRRISDYLNLCNYESAVNEISKNQSAIITSIRRIKYAENMAHELFDCFKDYKANKTRALKQLTAFYLKYNNFPLSINACDQALNNSTKTSAYKIFKNGLRSAMIHLNEYTYKNTAMKKNVKNFLNNLNKNNIKIQITSLYNSLQIPVNDANKNSERKKILFTFLGAGDYSCTNYVYHSDNSESDTFFTDRLDSSKVLGLSIASSMLKQNLDQLVILGTTSSNWPVVLQSISETVLKDFSEDSLSKYNHIIEDINESFYINNQGNITGEQISNLNTFFRENKDTFGIKIILISFAPQIEREYIQQNIIDQMIACTSHNAEVYFDITHSFRIMPIICIALIVYLQANKNVILKDLFYGTVEREDEYHKENQHEADQRSKIFRIIDELKNTDKFDDRSFQKIMSDIEDQCHDISDNYYLNGVLYSMKNIVNNLNYANAISAYNKTGNLQTLETIISAQIKLTDETINKFSAGAFYDNIINTSKAIEYLKDFYESLKNSQCDTILTSLKNNLLQQLSWIDYSDQSFMKLVQCKSRMETAISNNNYFQALTNGYEGFKFIARCISIQLKEYINSNNTSEKYNSLYNYTALVKHLRNKQGCNFIKIKNNCKQQNIIQQEINRYKAFLNPSKSFDFDNYNNNYIETEILSKISNSWPEIKKYRNDCTHPCGKNKSTKEIITTLKNTVTFFETIINKHKANKANKINLELFTLI